MDTLIDIVADTLKISSNIIKSNSKQQPGGRARAIICYLASERIGISGAQLARQLRLSPSAVSKLIIRGRQDGMANKIDSKIFRL